MNTQSDFFTPLIFAAIFIPFLIIIGDLIHRKGLLLIESAFGDKTPLSQAVASLLRIGWYLVTVGLLLWNLGISGKTSAVDSVQDFQIRDVLLRLGVAIFVVGFLHGFNVFALSLFHKKNRG